MKTLDDIRAEFPYLKTGKKYFNHAAISPLPLSVKKTIDEYLNIRTESDIEPYFITLSDAKGAKENLGKLLNAAPSLLSWTPNVSSSLNIIAQGFNWDPGDEIILNDIEFPSNVYPFLNLKKNGINILFAKNTNGAVDIDEIEKLVTTRTKMISISMVQFLSGYKANLKVLGEFCKHKGIIFGVDGIQGVGAANIDIKECNIDFFAGGTHKWLMGLQGLGYLYISEKLMERIDSKFVGWTSVKDPWQLIDYELDLLDTANKFETGTLPRLAIIVLNSSLEFFGKCGYDYIHQRILANSLYLAERLREIGIKTVLEKINDQNIAGIISIKFENAQHAIKKLEAANIICSLREGVIRISPHFYNNREDLDYLIEKLKKMIN